MNSAMKGLFGFLLLALACSAATSASSSTQQVRSVHNGSSPSPVICNLNGSCTNDTDPTTSYYNTSASALSWNWSTWCPYSYRIGSTTSLCIARSCAPIRDQDRIDGVLQWMANSSVPNTTVTLDNTGPDPVLCLPFSQRFNSCNRQSLLPSEYDIMPNGSLWNKINQSEVPLGEYFRGQDGALVCNGAEDQLTAKVTVFPYYRCVSYVLHGNQFRFQPSNRSLYIDPIHEWIEPGYFTIEDNGTTAYFCYEYKLAGCTMLSVLIQSEWEFLPDFQLKSLLVPERHVVYPIGNYYMSNNGLSAIFCVTPFPTLRSLGTQYLYASISLISCICLFLALLAHVFFPRLNYHAKSLMCHAYSMFMMYLMITVRYFGGNPTTVAGNMTLFVIMYIFSLAAFLWLSVLAYDFWRIFSRFQGTITPGENSGKLKWLVAKGLYAWGIPTVLCVITILVAQSPQHEMNVGLNLHVFSWFTGNGEYYFFYIPIAVILLVNLTLFVITVINIRRASSGTDILRKSAKTNRKLFRVYVKIFLVMGLTWFAEIISRVFRDDTSEYVWYVTDMINCLQGVLIFVIYVCKKNTLTVIKAKFGCIIPNSRESTQTTSSKKTENVAISLASIHPLPATAGSGS